LKTDVFENKIFQKRFWNAVGNLDFINYEVSYWGIFASQCYGSHFHDQAEKGKCKFIDDVTNYKKTVA